MKRLFLLQIASASLATCGAVCAQPSPGVTLFGIVDVNVSMVRAGPRSGVGNQTFLNDGHANGLNGSRWGVRASEDLGGLKAGAVLESGFNADSGVSAQGGRLFGRQAFVFLSSPLWGEVRLGRQYVLDDSVMFLSNPFGNGSVLNPGITVTNAGKTLPQFINGPRLDNLVLYQAPVFGGVTLRLQAAPGEGANDRFTGASLSYASGPVAAALSYEWNKDRVSGQSSNKVTTLGANYDFGAVKLWGGYQAARDLTTSSGNIGSLGNLVVTGANTFTARKLDVATIAVSVPFGGALFGANYTVDTYESASGFDQSLGKVAVGLRYGLSKNTFLYAAASQATGDIKDYVSQKRVVQAGLRTAF